MTDDYLCHTDPITRTTSVVNAASIVESCRVDTTESEPADDEIDRLFTFIERCKRDHAWPVMFRPAPRRTEGK